MGAAWDSSWTQKQLEDEASEREYAKWVKGYNGLKTGHSLWSL